MRDSPSPERASRIRHLVAEAAARPPSERTSFLDRAAGKTPHCAGRSRPCSRHPMPPARRNRQTPSWDARSRTTASRRSSAAEGWASSTDPSDYHAHDQLGLLYRALGREAEARRQFERFRTAANRAREAGAQGLALDATLHFDYAHLLSVLGEKEAALDQLEQAVRAGFSNYIWMKIHPDLEPLYEEPRFQQLLTRNLKR